MLSCDFSWLQLEGPFLLSRGRIWPCFTYFSTWWNMIHWLELNLIRGNIIQKLPTSVNWCVIFKDLRNKVNQIYKRHCWAILSTKVPLEGGKSALNWLSVPRIVLKWHWLGTLVLKTAQQCQEILKIGTEMALSAKFGTELALKRH